MRGDLRARRPLWQLQLIEYTLAEFNSRYRPDIQCLDCGFNLAGMVRARLGTGKLCDPRLRALRLLRANTVVLSALSSIGVTAYLLSAEALSCQPRQLTSTVWSLRCVSRQVRMRQRNLRRRSGARHDDCVLRRASKRCSASQRSIRRCAVR